MLVSFTLLVGCGESERAKVDDGGSQASGTQPAAERTAAEKTVKVSSVGRPAVARAGDVETCSVGDEGKRVGGRVPQSYSYEQGGERLECEIRKNGPGALEAAIISGDDFYFVHRQTGAGSGTINLIYSGKRVAGGASFQCRVSSVVSSVVSSTKSR